jgi:hypothetical protein
MSVDVAEVNRLLQASRGAHARYRQAANTPPPNYQLSERHVLDALILRLDAHDRDPEHTVAGWRDDKAPDADLIAFYVAYAKPLVTPDQMARITARFPAYAQIAYIP